MAEQGTLSDRLKRACEAAGYGSGGDTAAARKALMQATGMSKMGISKLFAGKSSSLTVLNLFLIADLLKIDARWLGTGFGDIRQSQLPTDALEVAAKLNAIQDPAARRGAIAAARSIAADPVGQMANIMASLGDAGTKWSPQVVEIANQLESITDPQKRKIAIAKATTAAFRLEDAPEEAASDARARPTSRRSTKS